LLAWLTPAFADVARNVQVSNAMSQRLTECSRIRFFFFLLFG
jgi:hypothetical protein